MARRPEKPCYILDPNLYGWILHESFSSPTLIETGMRRAGIVNAEIDDIDFKNQLIQVREKGKKLHTYAISSQGLKAIKDYIKNERKIDNEKWQSHSLFLPSSNIQSNTTGRLSVQTIHNIWKSVCFQAGVEGKTCHSARHAVGKHIIEKTGNVEAVQRQLGHKNPAYSMQYMRITKEELKKVMDER